MCYKEAFTLRTELGMPKGCPSFVSLRKGTIMFLATLAALFVIAASTPDSNSTATATSEPNEMILDRIIEKAEEMLSEADAPAGFYPRSKADGLLEVGTWVWSNSGDISCAWEGDLPAADQRCWQGNQETLFDYQRARIIDIEEWPSELYYRIMYEPFHPGQSGMPQWTAAIDEVFEGYNLPPEVREFSNLLVRTNW